MWDTLILDVHLATFASDVPYGAIHDGALAIAEGRIAWVGERRALPSGAKAKHKIEGHGAWVTPGFIDCHTHLVYAGHRAHEFDMRLQGASYEDISRAAGGILSTVRATRAASEQELQAQSKRRLRMLLAEGVTTI